MTRALDIRGLCKSYRAGPDRKLVLDSVSLAAEAGSIVCLLGVNGSGKTTLLKILTGLVLPDSGDVEVGGVSLAAFPETVQRRVGFSPGEERSFYGRLTGRENLAFFGALRGLSGSGVKERLEALERPLRLRELLDTPYQQSSAGMKQRLSLARAMLDEPLVLLLDEPTKSLDPLLADRFRAYVRETFAGSGRRLVIWATHQADEAWESGTEIVVLNAGRVAAQAAPRELLRRCGAATPKEAYRRFVQEAAP